MKTFTFRPPPFVSKVILSSFLVVFLLSAHSGFAQMSASGEQNACPQIDTGENVYTYTVQNIPNNAYVTVRFPGNLTIDGTATKINANTFEVSYASEVLPFTTKLIFEARTNGGDFLIPWATYELNVNVSVNAPGSINGGNILVCPNGSNVSLTTNTSLGCGFHCEYVWTAPAGVTLQANGGGNTGNQITVAPGNLPNLLSSGLPNGNLGQLQVKALWSNCGLDGDNYGYATVFSGSPLLNPRINGVPSQGYNCVSGSALLTAEYQTHTNYMNWTKIGGNGTIAPNGASCSASPNGFMAVKVDAGNGCGTSSYTYYLSECGNAAYTISPNPASESLTVDFEYREFAEGLLESIELLDLDGKSYYKTNFKEEKNKTYFKEKNSFTIDTKSLKRGNYVLHLNFGEFTDKKQIILK